MDGIGNKTKGREVIHQVTADVKVIMVIIKKSNCRGKESEEHRTDAEDVEHEIDVRDLSELGALHKIH